MQAKLLQWRIRENSLVRMNPLATSIAPYKSRQQRLVHDMYMRWRNQRDHRRQLLPEQQATRRYTASPEIYYD